MDKVNKVMFEIGRGSLIGNVVIGNEGQESRVSKVVAVRWVSGSPQ